MNVTKADIVERVAKNVGTNRTEAKAVVEEVLATVVDSLKEGNKIELRGFGVFSTKYRPARTARNPKTGETIELADRYVPAFKPSPDFSSKVTENLTKGKSAKKMLKEKNN